MARLAAVGLPCKLATSGRPRHKRTMRRLTLAMLLTLAACAPRPAPQSTPATTGVAPPAVDSSGHRTLNGMTAAQLIAHFGRPRIEIREGDGTKIQFAGSSCVLDAYLYPGQGGVARVSHIEARNLQGDNFDTQACVYALERR